MRNDLPAKPEKPPKPTLPPKPPRVFKRQKSKADPDTVDEILNDATSHEIVSKPMIKKPALPPKRPPPPSGSPTSKVSAVSNGEYQIPAQCTLPAEKDHLDHVPMIDDGDSQRSVSPISNQNRNSSPTRPTSVSPVPPVIPTIEVTDDSVGVINKEPVSQNTDMVESTVNDSTTGKDLKNHQPPATTNNNPKTSHRSTMRSVGSQKSAQSQHRKKCPVADGEASESSEYDDSCCMPTSKISVIIKNVLADSHQPLPAPAPRSFSSPAQAIYETRNKPATSSPKPAKPPPRPKPPDLSKRMKKPVKVDAMPEEEGTEDSGDYKDIEFKRKEMPCQSPYEELNFTMHGGRSAENLNYSDYHPYEEVGLPSPNVNTDPVSSNERQYEKISVCESFAPTGNISEIESVCDEQTPIKTDATSHDEETSETVSGEAGSGDTADTLSMRDSIQSEYITPAMSVSSLPHQHMINNATEYEQPINPSSKYEEPKSIDSQVHINQPMYYNQVEETVKSSQSESSPKDKIPRKVPPLKPAPPKIPKKPTRNISELEPVCNEQTPAKTDATSHDEETSETISGDAGSGDTADTLSMRDSIQSEYITPAISVSSLPHQHTINNSTDYEQPINPSSKYEEPKSIDSQVHVTQPVYYNQVEETVKSPQSESSPKDKTPRKVPPPKPAPPKVSKKPTKISPSPNSNIHPIQKEFAKVKETEKSNGDYVHSPKKVESKETEEIANKIISDDKSAKSIIEPVCNDKGEPVLLKTSSVIIQKPSPVIAPRTIILEATPVSSTDTKKQSPVIAPRTVSLETTLIRPTAPLVTDYLSKKKSVEEVNESYSFEKSYSSVEKSPNTSKKQVAIKPTHPPPLITNHVNKKEIQKHAIKQSYSFEKAEHHVQKSPKRLKKKGSSKEETVVTSGSYSFYEANMSNTQNSTYESYRKLPDPDEIKVVKKTPPARPPPPQPKRPPRKKQRSQTTVITRDEVNYAREKFQRSRRSQSLTEADLAKRLWMAEKPIKPPIDLKTLYTKVQKDPVKNLMIDVDDNKLKLDFSRLDSNVDEIEKIPESANSPESKMQCRPLPAPPPPPRTKRKSAENTPITAVFAPGTSPRFSLKRAEIEAKKLLESTEEQTLKKGNDESPNRLLKDHSPSVGSDLSSVYDSLYPKARWYDDGDAADESNQSSRVDSMDEGLDRLPNSDGETSSNIRQCMSSVISSRSSSSRKREEKAEKRNIKFPEKKPDDTDIYCYQFKDKSETSDTESSIKIRIRIEKKTERGGEEKVVVKRSVPITEVIRKDHDDTQISCRLSRSDSLSQIPDLVSHEEVDIPKIKDSNSIGDDPILKENGKVIEDNVSKENTILPQPDVVTISSASDSWHSALDTSSDSEGEEEPDSKVKKDQMYLIAEEITTSEKVYVDALKLLNNDFRKHILNYRDVDGVPVISESSLDQVLKYLPQLQILNENLLLDLCNRINSWDDNPRVADVLVKIGPYFKLYASYVREFESMSCNFDDVCRKNPGFAQGVKEFEMGDRCKMLTLKHHMLKPVQRVPRYKLLLEKYLKHVPENSEEYHDAQTALSIVSKVADHINQSIKDGDNFNKMIQIQSSVVGNFEIIRPGRMFLKEGWLNKLSRKGNQPRWFVLLSDCLLYMTPTPQGYKINYNLPLSGLKVMIPTQEDYQNEFSIISIVRSFSLSASSQEECESWILAINNAITNNISRRNTYNSVPSHSQGSKSDSEIASMTLGHQAPVWIPDARVTMCQICTTDFTVTFRRHHCRACGKVICKKCSGNQAALQYRKYRPARVCDECYLALDSNTGSVCGVSVARSRLGSPETESDATETETSSLSSASETMESDFRKKYGKVPLFLSKKLKAKSALEEVMANDQHSDISGYLQRKVKRSWKKSWFVVKDKVLYMYRASEDIKALESTPLLGYEVSVVNEPVDGMEEGTMFRLSHRGRPALMFHTDNISIGQKWIRVMKEATVLE